MIDSFLKPTNQHKKHPKQTKQTGLDLANYSRPSRFSKTFGWPKRRLFEVDLYTGHQLVVGGAQRILLFGLTKRAIRFREARFLSVRAVEVRPSWGLNVAPEKNTWVLGVSMELRAIAFVGAGGACQPLVLL